MEKASITGSLYNPASSVENYDNKAYDSYTLLNPDISIIENPDPDKVAPINSPAK